MSEPFCALCVDGTEGLEPTEIDNKVVLTCKRCREEHPRDGGYSFSEGARSSITAGKRKPGRGDTT